jgi:hypothetical protein
VYYFLVAILTLLTNASFAQSIPYVGGRANGAGYCAASFEDGWSVFNNPAGLASAKQTQLNTTCEISPAFRTFNRVAAAATAKIFKGGIGLGVYKFGDDLYREQCVVFGFGNKWGNTALGVKANYFQVTTEGFGRKGALTFSAGGITQLTPWLVIGAVVTNINQPSLTEDEKVPTMVVLNVSVLASGNIRLLTEVEKTIENKPIIKAGIEYQIRPKLAVRTGFRPEPSAAYFGFGFTPKKFSIDYAFSYLGIGMVHQASVGYKIERKP